MNAKAINFKATEMKTTGTENIVRFPNFKSTATETEVRVMSFVNTPNVVERNRVAKEYIKSRKRKAASETLWSILTLISLSCGFMALYFLGCIF